jgi:hypothetical protein
MAITSTAVQKAWTWHTGDGHALIEEEVSTRPPLSNAPTAVYACLRDIVSLHVDSLQRKLLKSDVIYLLALADTQQMSEAPGAHWEKYYADFFVSRYLK